MTIYNELMKYQDLKYRDFQSPLLPNIPEEEMIGVRTPDLRKIAKELFFSEKRDEFLASVPHRYYEENLIHMFVVSLFKDFNECVKRIEEFLPYVNCWSVCDQSTPKSFKKNHDLLLVYIRKWIDSSHTYTARFGIRMLMNEFLDNEFKEEYLALANKNKGEDYYLKMMVAWYFATALAKQYDAAIKYIIERKLEKWTHNKAIQKALESFRVSDEHKAYLRTLKY